LPALINEVKQIQKQQIILIKTKTITKGNKSLTYITLQNIFTNNKHNLSKNEKEPFLN